ncbi:hypothetical protein [Pimelobacter simplex]|uniref:hypothetical protein n=1 Tax=Nocardioides simplex TaxID=2045 RepID=UPI003AABA4A5
MKTPHRIAALAAAVIVPLALVAPAAQADSSYTGVVDASDPSMNFPEPDPNTDQCFRAGGGNQVAHYDTVTFTSRTNGPRRIVIRGTGPAPTSPFAIWAYRNGTCVAADYLPDDSVEGGQGIVDLDNVVFAKGDKVLIRFFYLNGGTPSAPWKLDILQPGTANAAAAGKGASYVKLPEQVSCGSHKATVKATGKARKVKSIVFKAGGKKVGSVQRVRPGQNIKLKKIPASATSIKAVVKLKGGGKAKVVRAYSACR